MKNLTASRLRELLSYNPETGVFVWRIDMGRWGCVKAGTPAGTTDRRGYKTVILDGATYSAHRLAFLYVNGEWPGVVDHLNGMKGDNRWANLRDTDWTINAQNIRKAPISNLSSGLLGAHFDAKANKWRSSIRVDKRLRFLGLFDTAQEAHNTYLRAKRVFHEGCTL